MRAIFYPFQKLQKDDSLIIEGDSAHHLNVVRARIGDDLLLLNGKGSRVTAKIQSLDKKSVSVNIIDEKTEQRKTHITLAVANPKKDAFEDILKMAVELGVDTIQPLSSQFSQYDYVENERTIRLLESGLIQSNNPFLPQIAKQISLKSYLQNISSQLYFFNSRPDTTAQGQKAVSDNFHLLIGPEGGFSPEEVELINGYSGTVQVHLPTPILRAPTAVSASIGYLLALKNAP